MDIDEAGTGFFPTADCDISFAENTSSVDRVITDHADMKCTERDQSREKQIDASDDMIHIGFQRNRKPHQPKIYQEMKSDVGKGRDYIYSIS